MKKTPSDPFGKHKTGSLTAKYNLVFVLFIIAIALTLLFYLVPFDFKGADTSVKKIYFADNITEAHQKIIDLFNKRYRGQIEVVPVNLPFTKFNTNERKELIARTLRNRNSRIDVFTVDQIWVPRFAKWAVPISRYFSRKEISRILPAALRTCYHRNILVSMPLHIDIGTLFYRKDLLQKFENTADLEARLLKSLAWEDFIALQKIFPGNEPLYVFQGDNYEGLVLHFLEILAGSKGGLLENGRIRLNHPEVIESAQLLVDLIHKYRLSPAAVTSFNESASYRYVLEHDIPFFRGWPGFLKEILQYPGGAEKAHLIGIAALPHFQEGQPAFAFGGWNLMISQHSSKKEEALLFLKYVASEDAQKILYETAGFLPVMNSFYEEEVYAEKYPDLMYFKELLARGIHRPADPGYTEMSDILSTALHKALKGEIPVTEALQTAEANIRAKQLVQVE